MKHYIGIVTKYHGPTNFQGARISAKRFNGTQPGERIIRSYNSSKSSDDAHAAVARDLAIKMGFDGITEDYAATDSGYVFLCKKSNAV